MPPIVLVIIMAVLFTAVMAVGQSLYWAYLLKKESEKAELARRLGTASEDEFNALFREGAKDAAAQAMGKLGDTLQEALNQADMQITVTNLLTRMGIAALVGAALGLYLVGGPGLIAAVIFAFIPYFLVKRAGNVRARMLLEQLPEALD